MSSPEDPYFAGRVKAEAGKPRGSSHGTRPLVLAWVAVYLLNLIFPLFAGWSVTGKGGRVGMFLGILLLLATGCLAVVKSRRFGIALVVGGVFVAVGQLLPIAQLGAGTIGLYAAQLLGLVTLRWPDDDIGDINGEPGGFVATVITGGLLMVPAAIIGMVFQAIWRAAATPGKPSSDG